LGILGKKPKGKQLKMALKALKWGIQGVLESKISS